MRVSFLGQARDRVALIYHSCALSVQTFRSYVIDLNDCLRKESWQYMEKEGPKESNGQAS